MEFGIQFFPAVGPEQKSAEQYFDEALDLVEIAEPLGYTNVRIVEHYFEPYGGYSPNPLIFLTAASQRTKTMRLITGAVLPVFTHPLKLAGEIAMLDAISHGRLEVGFARAFLPHEFFRFNIPLDESRGRFDEGVETVRRLLEEESVTSVGRYHTFGPTTSLPRPTQKPRPPFWIAAIATPASFEMAGRLGYAVMAIPMGGADMKALLDTYRTAWRDAGHPGHGRIMLAFHMFCDENAEEAARVAREPLNRYLKALVDAAGHWMTGTTSTDYVGYDKIIAKLKEDTFESQVALGGALVGTPEMIVKQLRTYSEKIGGFDIASLQVNFYDVPFARARKSMELFARDVMPQINVPEVAVR